MPFFVCAKYAFFFLLEVVSSAIIDKYIGESARLIREMFNYAREHQVGDLQDFCTLVLYDYRLLY